MPYYKGFQPIFDLFLKKIWKSKKNKRIFTSSKR